MSTTVIYVAYEEYDYEGCSDPSVYPSYDSAFDSFQISLDDYPLYDSLTPRQRGNRKRFRFENAFGNGTIEWTFMDGPRTMHITAYYLAEYFAKLESESNG